MFVLRKLFPFFYGDQARYPFKLRGRPLVTIPIVVADNNKIAVNQYNDPRISNSKLKPT